VRAFFGRQHGRLAFFTQRVGPRPALAAFIGMTSPTTSRVEQPPM
jgi:hypothetical protein